MSVFDELCELIDAAGLRVTLDMERDITKPCIICGKAPPPFNRLVTVGHRTNRHHDAIKRPVCAACGPMIPHEANSGAT